MNFFRAKRTHFRENRKKGVYRSAAAAQSVLLSRDDDDDDDDDHGVRKIYVVQLDLGRDPARKLGNPSRYLSVSLSIPRYIYTDTLQRRSSPGNEISRGAKPQGIIAAPWLPLWPLSLSLSLALYIILAHLTLL